MENYERLITEELKGDTPKEKYEFLKAMKSLLERVAYPRRGTEEVAWEIQDVADKAQEFMDQHL